MAKKKAQQICIITVTGVHTGPAKLKKGGFENVEYF